MSVGTRLIDSVKKRRDDFGEDGRLTDTHAAGAEDQKTPPRSLATNSHAQILCARTMSSEDPVYVIGHVAVKSSRMTVRDPFRGHASKLRNPENGSNKVDCRNRDEVDRV